MKWPSLRFVLVLLVCLVGVAPAQPSLGGELAEEIEDPLQELIDRPHRGDLDSLIQRRLIRVAVTYSKTHFFLDKGRQYGLTSELLAAFEKDLRKRYQKATGKSPLSIVALPMARDELLPALVEGRADLAIANLTMTPDRLAVVDFSEPTLKSVRELIVTHRDHPELRNLENLAGRQIMVRRSSSYFTHLMALNERLRDAGLAPVEILEADEHLETEDLLEMVNAGLIEVTVADQHLAGLWRQIFPEIRVHEDLVLNESGNIGIALRKQSPKLKAEVNRFLKSHRPGTTFGNVLRKRYLESPHWARRALGADERQRFTQVADLFKRYAGQYEFDYLMVLAQGYQESGLDHSRKSPVGAIGIMQVMPETGKSLQVGDIRQVDANVHAGTKYLRQIIDQYFDDPAIDTTNRMLFAFASYNAGPTRIKKLRQRAEKKGLNPNLWFGHVEHAVAHAVGQETVRYVANISKYYVAYRLVQEQDARRASAARGLERR